MAIATVGLIMMFMGDKNDNKGNSVVIKKSYVALGDSVAAGLGLVGASDSSACNRTNESYPVQFAGTQKYELKSLACSGATIEQGVLGGQNVNGAVVAPQIDNVTASTDFVTITVGANDVGWSQIITECLLGACATADNTARNQARLEALGQKYQTLFSTLKTKIGPNTKVLITGYYHIYPESNALCAQPSGMSDANLLWLRQQADALNETIRTAANDVAFARYVEVNFDGHELCKADSWIQGIQESAPFHPTAEGQKAISRALAAASF